MTKLEKCLDCKHHVDHKFGFIICNYWKQNQQHVTQRDKNGEIYVIGCSLKAAKKKVS
ncbi:MAG TPA: hypothetical protein PLA51_03900 [Spirochaetota bacterium]|jgi:hypothetical protein|nr:hypothetical protein [Spirochaetota bacterium]OQB00234.1 MAG: hypothetical protein BWY23_00298 [Spirochaetes bacterium ADurb.Bin218]HON15601.1 hypothetical protein [Spirochaetota bacterium]HOQ12900.1 hypothetical protein [Spirochaetota bacterium]HOV09485.1 hypothetical protein [Spirochaetota bacterium]